MSNDARLDAIEAAVGAGSADVDEMRWAIAELRRLRKTTIAEGEFGELQHLDPNLLRADTAFDRCLLALAFIFNDFKDLAIFDEWLQQQKPAEGELSNRSGHWHGLRGHIDRLLVGMLHEFLNLLIEQAAVISSGEFQQLVATTPEKTRRAWRELGLLSKKVDDESAHRTLLFNALRDVRNHTAFHYGATKQLAAGYSAHFDETTEASRARAYYCVGEDMEATRFYYADAAANELVRRSGSNRGIDLRARVRDTLDGLNRALGPLIANHIAFKAGATRGFFSPPKARAESAAGRGPKRDKNRAKAARRARRKTRRAST